MKPVDVTIVGAGLAGLCCARRLFQCGISFQIIEASDAVGGRVRTDMVEGFRLDRGFQIYLPSYPEGRKILDYEALDLKPFARGAKIWLGGRFHRVADPRAEFLTALSSLANPIGSVADKFRLARFVGALAKPQPETSTLELLQNVGGFSPAIIDRLFKPFLGGVFLEPELSTRSEFGQFVLKQFVAGAGAIPALGMQQIPEQLARNLPQAAIRLQTRVQSFEPGEITLQTGEKLATRAIVLATEADEAFRLGRSSEKATTQWNSTANLYFAAPFREAEPILHLDGEGQGPLNSAVVMSAASPAYAPMGQSLISCSTIGLPEIDDEELEKAARVQLTNWFGVEVQDWRLLKIYRIAKALPRQRLEDLRTRNSIPFSRPGLYTCGDYRVNSSINGAMLSGFNTAQDVAIHLAEGSV
jgi:phytoene dehydrogenase-like protein